MKKSKHISTIILISIIVFFYIRGCDQSNKIKNYESAQAAMNDTIKYWKGKDNKNHYSISTITGVNIKQFNRLKSKDKEIKELQNLVKSYKDRLKKPGNSATILGTEVYYDTIFKILHDTNFIPGVCNFEDTISNDWIWSRIALQDQDLQYKLKIKNKYSIIVGEEKVGLFKRKPYVEIISDNPYYEVTSLRTYQVPTLKPKRFGIGPQVGVGINQFLQPSVYLGLGVSWNPIRF